MSKLISIVMSAYNAEEYLAEAIESVLAQTYPHFEFIIINDGSKDRTLEIIKEYQAKDNRIKLISHENKGLALSLNRGLEMAQGDFIARFDADDVMMPNRLERQLTFFTEYPEATMSSCHCYFINAHGKILGIQKYNGYESKEAFLKTFKTNRTVLVSHTGFICRKEDIVRVGGYRSIPIAEDKDLFTRMAEHGSILLVQDEILMKYRMHNTSIMASGIKKNLYKLVSSSWVDEMAVQRQNGEKEISFEDYQKKLDKEPFMKKFMRNRTYYAYIYYKEATTEYAHKNYHRFIFSLFMSFINSPSLAVGKILRVMKSSKS